MTRQIRVDASAVVKGQDGQTGNGENGRKRSEAGVVERVPIVAVTCDEDEPHVASLHGTEREAKQHLRSGTLTERKGILQAEGLFDGTRFDIAFGTTVDWAPRSWVDVPPKDKMLKLENSILPKGLQNDFYAEGFQRFEQFYTREQAIQRAVEHNQQEYCSDRPGIGWAVVIEIGRQMDVSTTAILEIGGSIGTFEHRILYPVRIAKLTPEELERYKIEAASEEPAVV
jgi:hypothetical protein